MDVPWCNYSFDNQAKKLIDLNTLKTKLCCEFKKFSKAEQK